MSVTGWDMLAENNTRAAGRLLSCFDIGTCGDLLCSFADGVCRLSALRAAPGVDDERHSDDAVGDEHAEVLADGGVAEHVLAGIRRHDEEQVEQDAAQKRLRIRRAYDRRAADEDGRAGIQADLLMRAIGL